MSSDKKQELNHKIINNTPEKEEIHPKKKIDIDDSDEEEEDEQHQKWTLSDLWSLLLLYNLTRMEYFEQILGLKLSLFILLSI